MNAIRWTEGEWSCTLLRCAAQDRPLVLWNAFEGDGSDLYAALKRVGAPGCNLLTVSDIKWERDLTPWACEPIFSGEEPYTGGADAFLKRVTEDILPKAYEEIRGMPTFSAIAGYSLAGLFALYALYRCDAFDRVASMSGSLWYPGFVPFIQTHTPMKRPEAVYLSLGDREARTRNPILRTVQENTEAVAKLFSDGGVRVTWELNPGNHFNDAIGRSARGVSAILQ